MLHDRCSIVYKILAYENTYENTAGLVLIHLSCNLVKTLFILFEWESNT